MRIPLSCPKSTRTFGHWTICFEAFRFGREPIVERWQLPNRYLPLRNENPSRPQEGVRSTNAEETQTTCLSTSRTNPFTESLRLRIPPRLVLQALPQTLTPALPPQRPLIPAVMVGKKCFSRLSHWDRRDRTHQRLPWKNTAELLTICTRTIQNSVSTKKK